MGIHQMSRRRGNLWTIEELRVLAAIYFNSEFSIGDDARDECRAIADAFGRTPSSIDRQWRNMHAIVMEKGASYNVGQRVKEAAAEYLSDPRRTKAVALSTCRSHSWPLMRLIEDGSHEPLKAEPAAKEHPDLIPAIVDLCSRVQFKSYPASFGFEVEERIQLQSGDIISAKVQAIHVPHNMNDGDGPTARAAEVAEAIAVAVPDLEVTVFRTGRFAIFGALLVTVRNESFKTKIDVTQI